MPSGMEPEMKRYLRKVLNTIFIGLLWLMLNVTFGIYFGFAFSGDGIGVGNIIYYAGFLLSLGGMLWLFYRMWKEDF